MYDHTSCYDHTRPLRTRACAHVCQYDNARSSMPPHSADTLRSNSNGLHSGRCPRTGPLQNAPKKTPSHLAHLDLSTSKTQRPGRPALRLLLDCNECDESEPTDRLPVLRLPLDCCSCHERRVMLSAGIGHSDAASLCPRPVQIHALLSVLLESSSFTALASIPPSRLFRHRCSDLIYHLSVCSTGR